MFIACKPEEMPSKPSVPIQPARDTIITDTLVLSYGQLKDKIKGGWAGQTIGVTYGGPTEFKWQAQIIPDAQEIEWYTGYVKDMMNSCPDLYDDVYVETSFLDVIEKKGINAHINEFSNALAKGDYNLWGANQMARFNILHGIDGVQSGYWLNNVHCDDLDFQIESDFIGLMNPAMPNSSSAISDKIGHIMAYGDGWYGGVFFSAMYTLTFVSDSIEWIVTEALKAIPKETKYYKCIADVIRWHNLFPDNWKQTWRNIQMYYSDEDGCPDGVFNNFNPEARFNSAYVVLALLYGGGDFGKTIDIATRCGQDSDCNPSSAGGILGAILGYSQIPRQWMNSLNGAEDIKFQGPGLTLNQIYDISYRHALQIINGNGGRLTTDSVYIAMEKPKTVRYEQSFEHTIPVQRVSLNNDDVNIQSFTFKGTGFALRGEVYKKRDGLPDGELSAKLYIDGKEVETVYFPTNYRTRRIDAFWKFGLPNVTHEITIKTAYNNSYGLRIWDYIIYSY